MTEAARPRGEEERYAFLLGPLVAVLVTLLLVFFVFFNYTTVDGESMLPNLWPEDRLLFTKGYDAPLRGDIIVFRLKEGSRDVEVVKRVVAVPGDRVETRGDRAWVNGEPEPGSLELIVGDSRRPTGPTVVPRGKVFVLGDNRVVSLDSRFIGLVDLDSVLGRAVAVYSPVTRLRVLDSGR